MPQPPEFIFDVAHGDIGVSRQLRKSLEALQSVTANPDLRKRLGDVLAGRASMREFGMSDAFAQILDQVPKPIFDKAASMSEEERNRLAEQGQAELERLRNQQPEPRTGIEQPPSVVSR